MAALLALLLSLFGNDGGYGTEANIDGQEPPKP